jgi:hypothetical protein
MTQDTQLNGTSCVWMWRHVVWWRDQNDSMKFGVSMFSVYVYKEYVSGTPLCTSTSETLGKRYDELNVRGVVSYFDTCTAF